MNIFKPALQFLGQGGQLRVIITVLSLSWVGTLLFFLFPEFVIFGTLFPRNIFGLFGVLTGPLIHSGIGHVFSNTLSFLILSSVVSAELRERFPLFLLQVYLLNGVGLWCVGRATFHLGLSGVVFSLLGFLLLNSVLSKNGSIPAFLIVAAIFYIDILKDGLPAGSFMSWDGHLVGLTVGFLMTYLIHKKNKS
jgi:membrane associated rhomboid family serine protease